LLDIGTGSGCIALALKNKLKNAQVRALDISKKAIEIAQENALELGLNVEFLHCNFLEETPISRADILVSNPPYIGTAEKEAMHKNVLEFEPHLALFVEDDVLIFYKRLALLSERWNSIVYAETSEFYCDRLANWLTKKNFIFEFRKDLQGKTRFVKIRPNIRD
jgi:release factor glutamine methyltransferase